MSIMKRFFFASGVVALLIIAVSFKSTGEEMGRFCGSTPTWISGPTSADWNGPQLSYLGQCVTNAVEYEWTLNLNSGCPASQTTSSPNLTLSPGDFGGFLHGSPCGTYTLSMRAKVDDGVNPPYWTGYVTINVTITAC